MKPSASISVVVLAFALGFWQLTCRADIADRPEVRTFIRQMQASHRFDGAVLDKLFRQVEIQGKILESIARPAETKPWRDYRKILVTEAHIQGGVDFWSHNRAALSEAAAKYGVAPEMIVAIIGVETKYGQNPGNYRVIDALSTLAFDYPRRADFFRKELEEFLLLCREEGIDPALPRGSYAGAMGMPQFMPSSYRRYAADLDGDHRRNIWTNPADAIASVAHYFSGNGWQSGEPIAFPASTAEPDLPGLQDRDVKPDRALTELRKLGVNTDAALPGSARVKLISLEADSGPEYWLVLHNFYVITRYNHSPLYAMAAFQLSQAIKSRWSR